MLNKIKDFIPPILMTLMRYYFSDITFSGPYNSWNEANKHCQGYDDESIFLASAEAALKVRDGVAACERDSMIFDEVQYSWPVTSTLLKAAIEDGNSLRVLDFGGGLGSGYYQNRSYIESVKNLSWVVVEQEKFVDFGIKNLSNSQLSFRSNLLEAIAALKPNVILLSSSLHYLEFPKKILLEIICYRPKYIVIDRSPQSEECVNLICKQNIKNPYRSSYPFWLFSKNFFHEIMSKEYEMVGSFSSNDYQFYRVGDKRIQYKGFIFSLKNA